MARIRTWFWLVLIGAFPAAGAADTVVLLHGLGRGPASMHRMAAVLERDGHEVRNVEYASTRDELSVLADAALGPVFAGEDAAGGEGSVHVVTHSMGGILLRQYLHDHGVPARLGRVVMLGPPNQGSEIVDRLGGWRLFRWINGPSGARLGTGEAGAPSRLGEWPAEVALGVIAGDRTWNPLYSSMIPGADDGKVSVERTHLTGERDHVVVKASHTWLMWRRAVIDQTRTFLREGRFADQP